MQAVEILLTNQHTNTFTHNKEKNFHKPQKMVRQSGCNQHIWKLFPCRDKMDLAFQARPVNKMIELMEFKSVRESNDKMA